MLATTKRPPALFECCAFFIHIVIFVNIRLGSHYLPESNKWQWFPPQVVDKNISSSAMLSGIDFRGGGEFECHKLSKILNECFWFFFPSLYIHHLI